MNFWLTFWTVVLAAALGSFAILAVVVGIGGMRDLRDLFRSISERQKREKSSGKDPSSPA
jgi:hypothetical protein